MLKSLIISSLIVNLGLIVGRLSGFFREAMVASVYGVTGDADVVVLMLTVPDLLVSILTGGALGAALIPEFSQRRETARSLLQQMLLLLGLLFLLLSSILYWNSDWLVRMLAPGFSEVMAKRASLSLSWVIWLVPLTVLSGVMTAYLHYQRRFMVPALGTLIVNMSIIVGLYLVYLGYGGLYLLSIFVLIGGALRLSSQVIQVQPLWRDFQLDSCLVGKNIITRYGQAMLSGSLLLLYPVVARAMASYQGEGGVAVLNYATRLIELPLAVAVTFLSVVFFPRLARSFVDSDAQHRQLVKYGVQATTVLSVFAAIVLVLISEAYVHFVYARGAMSIEALRTVDRLLTLGLFSLPFQGLSSFLTAVYNSRKETLTPLLVNTFGLALYIVGIGLGIWGDGLQGLVTGMVVCYCFGTLILMCFLGIDSFTWRHVFLEGSFVVGFVCGLTLLILLGKVISQANFVSWITLSLTIGAAALAVILVAACKSEFRAIIKLRLISK